MTLPVVALALGLGTLTLQSGLGQPLSARIELNAAQKDELDTLTARVASQSVYRDNNVQYPAALTRARVVVQQGANGVPYLLVTTTQGVNEPFLDLLIEVSWATGRVTRDYTFLLDPPGAGQTQAVEPVAPIRGEATPRSTRQAARGGEAGPKAADGGDTYAVKRGDTLSKIAKQYKAENISLEQMLIALFQSNENAFDGKNINRLRTGQILNIPPADQAGAIAQPEAAKIVRVQAADWRAYRDRVAAAAPASDATGARQSAGGKITAAVEDKGASTQPGKDQLKVSREAGAGKGGVAAGVAMQAEDAAAKDKALREANQRVADLEKTLKEMQKAAELKNQTLAEMQSKAEAGKGNAAEAPKADAGKVASATPPVIAPPAAITTPAAKAPEATAPAVTPPSPQPAPDLKSPAATPPAPAPETKAAPPPAPKVEPPKVVVTKPLQPEPSFFDLLVTNTPTWAIGAGAIAVLAGIGVVAARRRKTTKFEDSIISGTDIKTNTVFGSTGGGVVNTGDNSLASDFSREGLGNIDTDEVDPIAEAEVYLAYGRDAQAEEILKEALKKDPQRQEIYLKLLEIHAQHNKPSAFETVASELYSVSGGQGETWQKAMGLGRQLDPSNPLFNESGGAAAFAAAVVPAVEESAEPVHPPAAETHVFSVAPELKPEPRADNALDFHLDEEISLSPTSAAAAPKTPASILAGADEEIAKSTRIAESGKSAVAAAAGIVAGAAAGAAAFIRGGGEKAAAPEHDVTPFEPESIPHFDLDFNLDTPTKAAPEPKPMAPRHEPALATEAVGAPAPQLARPAAAIELDKLDLAFDPQRSTFEDPTPSVLDGQWHDAATKLDLAKAYQEMGDVEGAREILQEVLHEGDDQQKTEAQALLAKLA
jgi:pilus assembly protein FimV